MDFKSLFDMKKIAEQAQKLGSEQQKIQKRQIELLENIERLLKAILEELRKK